MAPLPRLILASASPRRRDLLAGLGLEFEVRPVDLDESTRAGEAPTDYVLRLARAKARALAEPGELVLAADTTVVLDGEILGKPADVAEAAAMMGRLAGREHVVFTGVALFDATRGPLGLTAHVEQTAVRIAAMSADELAWYAASGEPLDKAGAYAAQGLGSLFVESLQGNYSNVVGLPVPVVYRLFHTLGFDLRVFRRDGG